MVGGGGEGGALGSLFTASAEELLHQAMQISGAQRACNRLVGCDWLAGWPDPTARLEMLRILTHPPSYCDCHTSQMMLLVK